MTSFHCYDNSDVIATLVITNFHLYLMQLWWQFFQVFVYGDVPRAQTLEVLTLKNSIAPPKYRRRKNFKLRMTTNKWSWSGPEMHRDWKRCLSASDKKKKIRLRQLQFVLKTKLLKWGWKNGRKDHLIWHLSGQPATENRNSERLYRIHSWSAPVPSVWKKGMLVSTHPLITKRLA